jgi:hypothetical protein
MSIWAALPREVLSLEAGAVPLSASNALPDFLGTVEDTAGKPLRRFFKEPAVTAHLQHTGLRWTMPPSKRRGFALGEGEATRLDVEPEAVSCGRLAVASD